MSYTSPIRDMMFVMTELAALDAIAALPGCADATRETAQAILEEGARLCGEVLAPLNAAGDRQPPVWRDGAVSASPGFGKAFAQFVEGGWQGLMHPTEFGGQGLPKLLAAPCLEMLMAANLSFGTCPSLTDGAIEALLLAGSAEQKAHYLPKLISGEWTGTMNLTEPQAGSDLAMLRARAEPAEGGAYRVFGTKIFITWGEHDMASNIVHLVLARTPEAPEGIKGISLFLVPKFLSNADGSLGARNDVQCVSIEHKLGIRASPTAVLQFGDGGGATGFLIGEKNRGLEYMFVMMNAARFAVGLQGIGVADRAYQKAAAYAKERAQSRPVDGSSAGAVPIIRHPDVKRMLATMRALTEGARALAYATASHHDLAQHHPDDAVRMEHRAIHEYLVPIVKGWSTELSVEVTSIGIQVHGGMGFIEETGAAQYYRDARILPIYEGTTAIQANDLLGRKTLRDGGAVATHMLARIDETLAQLRAHPAFTTRPAFAAMHCHLDAGRAALARVIAFMLMHAKSDPNAAFAGSVPYLQLSGVVLCGWQMARALMAAHALEPRDPLFYGAKAATAHFYATHILPRALSLEVAILSARGNDGVLALRDEQF
ncbi:acyl-CoA dehydrogenase [Caballeronia sp. LZ062]|uniref:acyl-CoA dehydrogenase n=1 Tax=unclassified Caballeronia TaxID=2646786 RepID=UPI00285DA69B|nr:MULTISPECIES: acyl-CoA dehydrogenase [unclassified Caballeronia]MDR5856591.1 acyl-CoA dehydrogenase [Caballeronia sp. LZ050]MDR5873261.1 acyl-CoA dehydrogenase [Caballeronia sp. LZ062]